jgi:hypothetical protein
MNQSLYIERSDNILLMGFGKHRVIAASSVAAAAVVVIVMTLSISFFA